MPRCPNCGPIPTGPHNCKTHAKTPPKPKSAKYNSVPTEVDGFRFDSKLEASYYEHLKLCAETGELSFFLRQVPFHLRCGSSYRLDFLEVWADGKLVFTDTKGIETGLFQLKKKLVEDEYPIKINIVKRGDF